MRGEALKGGGGGGRMTYRTRKRPIVIQTLPLISVVHREGDLRSDMGNGRRVRVMLGRVSDRDGTIADAY